MSQKQKIIPLTDEDTLLEVRPRVRFKRALFSFFIVVVILVCLYLVTPLSRLGVIYFEGLNSITRSELISLINIDEDELFLSIHLPEVRNNIESHAVVYQAHVSRAWINRLRIEIIEYEVGACAVIDGSLFHILIDGTMLHESEGMRANCDEMMIHGLTQEEVEQEIPNLFVRQFMRVDPDVRSLVQVIEYDPRYGDRYRFSLLMLDGNVVKITTHTMAEELNLYPLFLEGLLLTEHEVGRTGVLHLDVGWMFVPHD